MYIYIYRSIHLHSYKFDTIHFQDIIHRSTHTILGSIYIHILSYMCTLWIQTLPLKVRTSSPKSYPKHFPRRYSWMQRPQRDGISIGIDSVHISEKRHFSMDEFQWMYRGFDLGPVARLRQTAPALRLAMERCLNHPPYYGPMGIRFILRGLSKPSIRVLTIGELTKAIERTSITSITSPTKQSNHQNSGFTIQNGGVNMRTSEWLGAIQPWFLGVVFHISLEEIVNLWPMAQRSQ